MARDPPLPIHPHDRALLRPLAALGKSNAANGGVSFLRRTEYISSNQGQNRFESSTSKDLLRLRSDPKRRRKGNVNKEHPLNILKHVVKGFDVAYPRDAYAGEDSTERVRGAEITEADAKAWTNPKHPSRPELQLLDSYPVLPDLGALPGVGSYIVTKFNTNPVPDTGKYDPRLDVAILRPQNPYAEKQEDRMAAYETDDTLPKPTTEYDYEYYLTEEAGAVRGIKRKFDMDDVENNDSSFYTFSDDQGNKSFKYDRVRAYETYQQAGDADDPYADSVALALHDPELTTGGAAQRLVKGAYFYPVLQRTNLRPKRKAPGQRYEEAQVIDGLRVTVRDGDDEEQARRLAARAKLDTTITLPETDEVPAGSQDIVEA